MTWRYEPRWDERRQGFIMVEAYYTDEGKPYGYCEAFSAETLDELEEQLARQHNDLVLWRREQKK